MKNYDYIFRYLENPRVLGHTVGDEKFTFLEKNSSGVKLWKSDKRPGTYTSLDIVSRHRVLDEE